MERRASGCRVVESATDTATMRTLARLVIAFALILRAVPCFGAPQGSWTRQPKDSREASDLRQYHLFVTAFRAGDDAAADAIASWPNKRILAVVALLPPARLDLPAWDPPQFKAAVMLHTTAAVRRLSTPDRTEGALFHLEVGTDVLLKGREGVRGFVAPWHTAIARMLLGQARLAPLDAFLEHAREQFPDEPAIQFLSGLFSEYIAGPPSFEEMAVPGVSLARLDQAFERMFKRRTLRLNDAARWLRGGLAGDPDDAEMLLHLGRVEMLRGHDDDALRIFRDIVASPQVTVDRRYLAVMFAGAVHERGGRIEDAIAFYRQAEVLIPDAQTAPVALSETLRRAGRGDESRQVLNDAVGARRPAVIDPWWPYFLEDSRVTAGRLEKLLAEARR